MYSWDDSDARRVSSRNRYQKIVIMIFKLIIVMVALFAIPAAEFADLPFACSAAALFFNLLWVGASQPFEDGWETVQEISSTLTNLVNTVVALMLGQDGLGDTGATVMLFVFNGLNLLLILFLIIFAPIRACWQYRRMKQAQEDERVRIANLNAQPMDVLVAPVDDRRPASAASNARPMSAAGADVPAAKTFDTPVGFHSSTFKVEDPDTDDESQFGSDNGGSQRGLLNASANGTADDGGGEVEAKGVVSA